MPLSPYLCEEGKNTQTQQCLVSSSLPPPFAPRDPQCAPSPSRTLPSILYEGTGARAAAVKQHYEQDIPKQLEGAVIWCCALVLGPPQNGPVTWLFSACHWRVSNSAGQGPSTDLRKENLISIEMDDHAAMCAKCTHSCGVLS